MSIKALQEYTYVSKYARYDEGKKRRETWNEAVDRVRDMHLRRYPQIEENLRWAFEQVRDRRVLGSQRALQYGGEPIERKHSRIYNCSSSYCDRIRFFQEAFWLLLAGCGVGFSVQKHHINKLPEYSGIEPIGEKVFVIPDTIEGWADALGVLLSTYFSHPEYPNWLGRKVVFDYSLIRPKGSLLSSGVGKAPGPSPLRRSLEIIDRLLIQRLLLEERKKLRPIDAYDVMMHASDAVLSGGVRRSACLALFSPDDKEMATAKIGNWVNENPQRARSNNSALLLRNETSKEQFFELIKNVREFGEPAFIWADSIEYIVNPCSEIGMFPVDQTTGKSGWAMCNLTEINGKKCVDEESFRIAATAATIIGTAQAGYTDFEYLGLTTEKIVRKEALLGVSITGIQDNPEILLDAAMQRKMAKLIVKVNEEFAEKLRINPAARCCTVKPAGSTSCILGTASGIHPHHARRYFRRQQANEMEAPLQHFKKINPLAVEKSIWSANDTDEVITFLIEVPKGARVKNDLPALEMLESVKLTQQNWVASGKVEERCIQPWLNHNVSNTILIEENEWEDVASYIYRNRKHFTGVSLLPMSGDLDYPQAPMVTIRDHREISSLYGPASMFASGLIVDGLRVFDEDLWKACSLVLDPNLLEKPKEVKRRCNGNGHAVNMNKYRIYQASMNIYEEQIDWVRRAKQFADRYFEGNVRKMTYCLKDVYNWKQWNDLKREYQDVDYSELIEEENNVKINQTIACAGGACELI